MLLQGIFAEGNPRVRSFPAGVCKFTYVLEASASLEHHQKFGVRSAILYTNRRGAFLSETSYTRLRQTLGSVFDRVANDHEIVIVRRAGGKNVAIVPADELAGLMETVHLLRSPKNARRLLTALHYATTRKAKPERVDQFRKQSLR